MDLEKSTFLTSDYTIKLQSSRDYYEQLYANTMDNLDEIDKFLEKYEVPKLNQD